jgi:hypothetical protein
MRVCFLLFFSSALLAAQSVEGEVYDSLTGAPLAGASVSSTNLSSGNATVSRTGAAGHFRLTVSTTDEAEWLALVIARPGYLRGHRDLSLRPRSSVSGLRVPLTPAAAISGKLVDEDGLPVEGAQVLAMRFEMVNGERTLAPAASATSNDLGEYRVTDLPAGSYYVGFQPGNIQAWDARYVAQFLGGGLQPNDASLIEALTGQVRGGVDVAGRVVMPGGAAVPRSLVVQIQAAESALRGFDSVTQTVDGVFRLRHVPPGNYVLRAGSGNSPIQAGDLLAASALVMGTIGVTGLVLMPHVVHAVDIPGTVVPQGGGTPRSMRIEVIGPNGAGPSTRSNLDGLFVLKGLMPGHYRLRVRPADPISLDMVTTGLDGRPLLLGSPSIPVFAQLGEKDVLHTGFDVDGAPAGSLRILLKLPILISGTVLDAAGNPVPNAYVAPVPEQSSEGVGMADNTGAFLSAVKTAGDYRFCAARDRATIYDSEYLRTHEKDFPIIRIVEGQNSPILVRLPAK